MLCTLGDENFYGFEEKSICDEELGFIKMLRDPKHVRLFNWVDLKCLDTRDLVDCPTQLICTWIFHDRAKRTQQGDLLSTRDPNQICQCMKQKF